MSTHRPTWAEVDLGAVRHNVAVLGQLVAPATLMAIVKADAYGHGAVPVAQAAVDAGAQSLGVALVEEGAQLRDAGVLVPILLLAEPAPDAAAEVVGRQLTPVVYTLRGIDAMAKAVADVGGSAYGVHLKVDTGMHRIGAAVGDVVALGERVRDHSELALDGICTHFAVAEERSGGYTQEQLSRFATARASLAEIGIEPRLVHAANSAGAINFPHARFDFVRIGIALYGVSPAPGLGEAVGLAPVLTLRSQVTHVKRLNAGDRVSYGRRYELPQDAFIATVPIGYADGVPRGLGASGGEVIIRGVRLPIAGTVTMDQLLVDTGDTRVEVGDVVTLLGRDGDATVAVEEWAQRLDTIGNEIVCGIGERVPRRYLG